jgi:hypothetical protein
LLNSSCETGGGWRSRSGGKWDELATQAKEVHARKTISVKRIRAEIDELFASNQDLSQVLEKVARLSVPL